MSRNSAIPWLASEPMAPYPFGPLIPQVPNGTGIEPAACRAVPSRRAVSVTVTGRVTPSTVNRAGAVSVAVAPEANAAGSGTGRASVTVASGWRRVFRLVASCGCVLPLTVIVASLIPNEPVSTRSPAMTTVPVTAFVRPTTSLLIHSAVSRIRNPAADPAPACHVPFSDPAALFGYRLRPGATFAVLATLLSATMRGLIITALSLPELAGPQAHGNPFGADGDWSLDAIGLTSIALAFLELDPAVEWDPQRVAAVRQALSSLSLPE